MLMFRLISVVAYSSTEYISYVCDAFIYLFLIFVFLYINYYLKDSTYDVSLMIIIVSNNIHRILSNKFIPYGMHLCNCTFKRNRMHYVQDSRDLQ